MKSTYVISSIVSFPYVYPDIWACRYACIMSCWHQSLTGVTLPFPEISGFVKGVSHSLGASCLPSPLSFHPHNHPTIILILQIKKLKTKEVKDLTQVSHTQGKHQSDIHSTCSSALSMEPQSLPWQSAMLGKRLPIRDVEKFINWI